MDLYSGRFPLDFISLCLDMSSREMNETGSNQPAEALEKERSEPDGSKASFCQPNIGSPSIEKPGEQGHTPRSAPAVQSSKVCPPTPKGPWKPFFPEKISILILHSQ